MPTRRFSPRKKPTNPSIVWNQPNVRPSKLPRPALYWPPNDSRWSALPQLVVGQLLRMRVPLTLRTEPDFVGVYPFMPLVSAHRLDATFSPGTLVVYAGEVRTVERKPHPHLYNLTLNVIKHTCITSMGRCVIHELNWFEPVL